MRSSTKAQSLIEFVLATTVVIPILLLAIDSFLILSAMQLNDATCKEAARQASIGDPRWALARAQQIVDGTLNSGESRFSLHLVAAKTTVEKSQLEALSPYGGNAPGLINVTTEVEVKPLVLHWFLGEQARLRFQTTSEIPSTYVFPNVWANACQDPQTLSLSNPVTTGPEKERL